MTHGINQTKSEILIVDDNPENLKVLTGILKQEGYEIRLAKNGKQALESMQTLPPNLVLLDIQMPKMDGYAVCRQMKTNGKLKSIPVIFISAMTETSNKVLAFEAGGDDYITKPFQTEEVLARVKTHLKVYNYQRQLEDKNLELLQKFQSTFEQAAVGIAHVDQTTMQLIKANQHFSELLGYSQEELLNKTIMNLCVAEDNGKDQSEIELLVQARQKSFSKEKQFIRKNGSYIWCKTTVSLVKSKQDYNSDYFIVIIEDISEQKRQEQLLKIRLQLSESATQLSVDEIVQTFLDEAEKITNSEIGFFHFIDSDQENIHLQTWSTNTIAKYCQAQGQNEHFPIKEAGVWVDCLKEGRPVIHNDYQSLSNKKGLPEDHVPLLRDLFVPVVRDQKVRAILGVGNKIIDYADCDVKSVAELADMTWDIIRRKQAEEQLQESEQNYREIYNAGSDAIIIHDQVTGQIVDVNQTMLDMYGYSRSEALSLEIGDISPGEYPFTQREAMKKIQMAVNEGPQVFEWFACNKERTCFWIEVALSKTQIGGKARILAVIRNINQRKLLDSELHLVKHSIEHSAYPFIWVQKDSRLFYVNEALCHSLGYTHEELCSMHISDIDADFSIEAWPDFWDKLKFKKTLTFESRQCKKTGDIFPVEITANHLEFEGQEHVFAYVKDISDRIQYENEQKNLEKQLQQAQKMEAIGTLAGGIAHDFNNILSSILGYAELALLDIPKESEPASYIDQVMKAGIRAGDLVKQILTFSRKQDQELKPLKVGLVINEVLKLLRSTLPATIKIKSYIDPNCGLILADPTQIHQIIMNLCTNAYHAMKSTGGVLSVNIKPINRVPEDNQSDELFLEPGPYLKLEVSDTGQGISEKNLERIFDPYFTTKKKGEGTGLGLSIVHSIIASFKGYLDVKSSIGKGTTFFIYLPVIEVAGSKSDIFKGSGSLPKGDEKIAFIDDEKSVVDFSKIMLESLGYRVTGFTDSRLVFDTFKSTPDDFDLVITDMTMPHMTGEELARQILEIRPDMPIILCTGYSDHLSSDQAKKIGIRDYIEKPILKRDLALIIRKILDEKRLNH